MVARVRSMTVDVYRSLPMPVREAFDAWLSEAIGEPLAGAYVYQCDLGEGFVTCHRFELRDGHPYTLDGEEAVTTTTTHPVRSLPPVWPC